MGSITFQFGGVCTHFRRGVVAGVPYRVVLPDAAKVSVGWLQVNDGQQPDQPPVLYYTTPHFASLQLRAGTTKCGGPLPDVTSGPDLSNQLNATNILKDGGFGSGGRLQIVNAIDTAIDDRIGDAIPNLTDFYPTYAPSTDVVLNGRAACYIDIFGGCVWVVEQASPKPPIILMKVETNGPPQLLVTPLSSSAVTPAPAAGATSITLTPPPNAADDFVMVVTNLEPHDPEGSPAFDGGDFDYLLHYLTASGGIPEILSARPPGLDSLNPLPTASLHDIGESFINMGTALCGSGSTFIEGTFRPRTYSFSSSSPACSDSIYP